LATTWHESEETALTGGVPNIMNVGVIKNSAPNPNMPANNPTMAPTPIRADRLMLIPARQKNVQDVRQISLSPDPLRVCPGQMTAIL